MLEGWRFFSGRRHHIASAFATQIYVAWLEEAIDRGDVTLPKGAPDFYTAKTAWTKCRWIGSPRGHIDELKEIQARREKYEMGITTLEDLCAEDGTDWEEVQEQRARERQRIRKLGEDPDSYLRRSGLSPAKQAEHDARVDESRRQDREAAQQHTEATLAAVGRIGEQMANGSAQLAAAVAHLPPPQVTVGETHVTVPERSVTVEPQINVAAPEVTVQPPDVHVTAPEVRVDVAAPNVNVQAPKPDPAEAEAYQRISDKLAGKKTTARKSGKRKP